MKIILDFVPNHTSDQHEWFQKSVIREPGFEDFYVWRDCPMQDGERQFPNNWVRLLEFLFLSQNNFKCKRLRRKFGNLIWFDSFEILLTDCSFSYSRLDFQPPKKPMLPPSIHGGTARLELQKPGRTCGDASSFKVLARSRRGWI